MIDLMKKLTGAFGPSGNEETIAQIIREEIEQYVDEIRIDTLGNLIGIKKGNGKKIMLAAHMDQIGFMVIYIDEKGFLRFTNLGGISVANSIHRRVKFKNGMRGVIGYETEIQDWKDIKLNRMYIDIGASSREEAEKYVSIGDVAVYDSETVEENGKLMGGAMDDRAGCAVLIQTLKDLSQSPHEIYFVFTVQEELGLRGAKTAAYGLNPDIAIAVDVTATGDTPKARTMAVELGKGAAIKVIDRSVLCHPKVKNLMIDTAEKWNIPYQMEVLEFGGTDAGAIHLTRSGVPSGVLSIPCRYIHSANETIDLGDLDNSVKLLTKILERDIDI